MDDKVYQRLRLHTESLRYIVTDLETVLRLAQELEPTGAIEKHDTAGTLADAFDKMLTHIDKILEKVITTRSRVERMAKLCNHELEFAEAEKKHGK